MRAYCFASGQIEFGQKVPAGALVITKAPAKVLREVLAGLARRAYDGQTLLVPGVPEANTERAKLDALVAFRLRVLMALDREAGR